MAYLKPTRLKCPKCGFKATIKLVVGVGPGSRRGDVPYENYHSFLPFTEEAHPDGKPTGRLLCPEDGTVVWTNTRSYRALGPLTQKETGNPLNRKWMAPGTAPAKESKKKKPAKVAKALSPAANSAAEASIVKPPPAKPE